MFDIIIPIGPNDINVIKEQIVFTKKNIIGYRNIYLISYDPSLSIDGCITIDESIFPFSINDVTKFHGKLSHNGWYLQQLLKLYAGFVIPDILSTYLVIDSDTFFLRPVTFINNNKCQYNYGHEYWNPYFEHIRQLLPSLRKQYPDKSGICHHMIFQTEYVKELMNLIESAHDNKPFWIIFLEKVDKKYYTHSGASEYELYFNFMIQYHSDKIELRPLKWMNVNTLDISTPLDYISYHHYNRNN